MNKLQEMIATLEADGDLGEMKDRMLQMLWEKQWELGDDVTDEKAEDAAAESVRKLLREVFGDGAPKLKEADEDVWNDTLQEAVNVVQRVFCFSDEKAENVTLDIVVEVFMEAAGNGAPDLEETDEDAWNETMQEAEDAVHHPSWTT